MNITAVMVKELRQKTGAGVLACKEALVEAEADMEKAIQILREQGTAVAAKRLGREVSEGIVTSYIHAGSRIGVLLELNCETDFVARTEDFQQLARDISMQIAAKRPLYVKREDVPESEIEKEKTILRTQAINEGKPENIADKIVEGRIKKFFSTVCLMEQEFIKDSDKTIGDLVLEKISTIGENMSIRRFARFELGEDTNS
jgi:elongation factor Ts